MQVWSHLMKMQHYDLHEIAGHLRALGDSPPTSAARREVEGYLDNRWQGLQAVAAQVLADWGGPSPFAPSESGS
jgi:hypothetical protein